MLRKPVQLVKTGSPYSTITQKRYRDWGGITLFELLACNLNPRLLSQRTSDDMDGIFRPPRLWEKGDALYAFELSLSLEAGAGQA